MIGIIGAMKTEVDALRSEMTDVTERTAGISHITAGVLYGKRVAVARCGIGKVHAAMCAQALIMTEKPSLLLNIGVAGALAEEADIADCVVPSGAVQHDMDTSPIGDPVGMISGINLVFLPCDAGAAEALRKAAAQCGARVFTGAVATGDRFVEEIGEKRRIRELFGADACDMEGAAIAQAAYELGVPFAMYRCVSDTLRGNGQEYALNADRAAAVSREILKRYLEGLGREDRKSVV